MRKRAAVLFFAEGRAPQGISGVYRTGKWILESAGGRVSYAERGSRHGKTFETGGVSDNYCKLKEQEKKNER